MNGLYCHILWDIALKSIEQDLYFILCHSTIKTGFVGHLNIICDSLDECKNH